MSVLSGKDGKVIFDSGGESAVADVTGWTLTMAAKNQEYASSATAGFTKRISGIKDAHGEITGLVQDDAVPELTVGAAVTLKLYLDGAHFYTVGAVIDKYELRVDVDRGEVEAWKAQFSSDGPWTEPSF